MKWVIWFQMMKLQPFAAANSSVNTVWVLYVINIKFVDDYGHNVPK